MQSPCRSRVSPPRQAVRPGARFLDQASRCFAPIALVLFAAVGLGVLDDYGVSTDEGTQRTLGRQATDYALGISERLLANSDRHYGVAFEIPLYVAEHVLALEDMRHVHLVRHFLTHLFFLAGGLFCYLLTHRLFGSRLLAAFALLVFVLHPRLYAHSFFNTKDIPFTAMFMAALFLIHRAFRLYTVGAFALVGVGLLAGIRSPGLMLAAAVVAMCAIDVYLERPERRKHVVLAGGAFLAALSATLYATSPYLWSDPLGRIAESLGRFAQFDYSYWELFRGELFPAVGVPPDYLPTWFTITTPLATLLLGVVGTVAVAWRGLTRPGDALGNTDLRFGALLVASCVLPVVAAAALGSTLYDGWRHLYFVYAPFAVLAIFGLHWLMSTSVRVARPAAAGLAAIGLAATVVEMVRIHPHQNVYFNALVDRSTPGHLPSRYEMDYWRTSVREAIEHLLERSPLQPIHIGSRPGGFLEQNRSILPRLDRERVFLGGERADYAISMDARSHDLRPGWQTGLFPPSIWQRRIYGSAIVTAAALDLSKVDAATADHYREAYRSTVAGSPLIEAEYDIYRHDQRLFYAKHPCDARAAATGFTLHVTPASAEDLPARFRHLGFVPTPFFYAVRVDGRCLASIRLPPYPISRFRTGQYEEGPTWWAERVPVWQVEYDF